ncbi:galactokinase [Psychromicrobium lacuslunae]|uniref:Galactokinase n=1 Tax=Psychromicrobium lacuslunae TaxID=1618207 RepID=A0A0D4BWA2_9MICC|nr:galactokinase [Psychromicrobium lacuslunae]AJT40401.1 galactokinase [Psychromicrobium lacuslunae]
MRILQEFQKIFGTAPDGLWQAPGRVNLIGEHTDYNKGFVLPFAIDRQASVALRLRTDQRILLHSLDSRAEAVQTSVDRLAEATGWSAYVLGVAWVLQQEGLSLPGFELLLDSTVPSGAGLSSSAAIESAVALALNDLLGGGLSREELVLVGQRAENEVVGAPTGILDQSASLLAAEGKAVFLDCLSRESRLVPLDLPASGLSMLVIDTKVSHAHADGGYADRRASCERAAEQLGVSSLRELGVEQLTQIETRLDQETFRRVRHIVTENARVLKVVASLAETGPEAIGELLNSSHLSMRDDFEISSAELDLAVQTAQQHGALGARMTGGGFGGSAIALIPQHREVGIRQALLQAFADAGFGEPDLFTVLPGPGAQRIIVPNC